MVAGDTALKIDETSDGVAFDVKVHPGAGKSAVNGLLADALSVNVKAQPEGGKANREVEKVLAKALGLDRESVKITAGMKSRRKRVRITGLNKESLEAVLKKFET